MSTAIVDQSRGAGARVHGGRCRAVASEVAATDGEEGDSAMAGLPEFAV